MTISCRLPKDIFYYRT
uniref:Uncharacterized protein n=1 Tax=Lepeophtheirus salmonis TaxID=72036 RepID=A0A0K2UL61_LEPSM